jgi:hypothetical protein
MVGLTMFDGRDAGKSCLQTLRPRSIDHHPLHLWPGRDMAIIACCQWKNEAEAAPYASCKIRQ